MELERAPGGLDRASTEMEEHGTGVGKRKVGDGRDVEGARSGKMERHQMWVEKHRPASLEEVLSHDEIMSTLTRLIDAKKLPHLLLHGPPGTGKTTAALACARRMYGKQMNSMVLELNASDDRGIDVVREQIRTFASTRQLFGSGVKLIILDEADSMTSAAQMALRRIMEMYSRNTRFCLICNYVNKLIPAIQSRCTKFRLGPLKPDDVRSRIKDVARMEGVHLADDGLDALVELGQGDMRKSINILQSTAMAVSSEKRQVAGKGSDTSPIVTREAVHLNTGAPLPSDIEQIVHWLLNSPFNEAVEKVHQRKLEKGLALHDILLKTHEFVLKIQLPPPAKIYILKQMSDMEMRLANGGNEKLNLLALVGAFKFAADVSVASAS
ncbi:Replication factor C subunit 5 [Porphyridium purpureum]|uniref:Replication factor C subunit 5 n=1 Tax=Porphyridium purpureum TaxID=35688 RepID=A0A5J4Z8D6_PORPP|nr:Replication factor C subunit 5 [Porphyridium purpureum]|eukprot:POR6904..scf295_1